MPPKILQNKINTYEFLFFVLFKAFSNYKIDSSLHILITELLKNYHITILENYLMYYFGTLNIRQENDCYKPKSFCETMNEKFEPSVYKKFLTDQKIILDLDFEKLKCINEKIIHREYKEIYI